MIVTSNAPVVTVALLFSQKPPVAGIVAPPAVVHGVMLVVLECLYVPFVMVRKGLGTVIADCMSSTLAFVAPSFSVIRLNVYAPEPLTIWLPFLLNVTFNTRLAAGAKLMAPELAMSPPTVSVWVAAVAPSEIVPLAPTEILPFTVNARAVALLPITSPPLTVRLFSAAEFASSVVVPALMTTSSPASGTRLQLPTLVQVAARLQLLEPTDVQVSADAAGVKPTADANARSTVHNDLDAMGPSSRL